MLFIYIPCISICFDINPHQLCVSQFFPRRKRERREKKNNSTPVPLYQVERSRRAHKKRLERKFGKASRAISRFP
jgi:hypothetical protein